MCMCVCAQCVASAAHVCDSELVVLLGHIKFEHYNKWDH